MKNIKNQHIMKGQIALKLVIIALFVLGLRAVGYSQANQRIAGAELQIIAKDIQYGNTDPKADSSFVETRLTYFRDCDAQPGRGQGKPALTRQLVIFYSKKCCETIIDTVNLDTTLSEKDATPICPFNNPETKCDNQNAKLIGYKTEVFRDTMFKLPCRADDWRVGHLSATSLTFQNFLQPTQHPQGQGPVSRTVPLMIATCATYAVRAQTLNMRNLQNNRCDGTVFIEATYSNDVDQTIGANVIKIANTTPYSAANPFIFQCKSRPRNYKLGYYDINNHDMTFATSDVYIDAPADFTNPALLGTSMPMAPAAVNGATFNSPFGNTTPASSYSVASNTGDVSLTCFGDVGKYKAGYQILEFNGVNQIGKTTRDILLTIFNSPNCTNNNSISNSSDFYPDTSGVVNLVNCRELRPSTTKTIELCANTSISFDVKAFSTSTTPGANVIIVMDAPSALIKSGAIITPLYSNANPGFIDAAGRFTWNVPDSIKPGTYPVLFQIRDCIDGYIVSETLIVNLRVNRKVEMTWKYVGFSPQLPGSVFSLPTSGRAFNCGNKLLLQFNATSTSSLDKFTWTSSDMTNCITGPGDLGVDVPTIIDPTQVYEVYVSSSQYCLNKDTIRIIPKFPSALDPEYDNTLINDSCFGSILDLKIKNTAGLVNPVLYDWQALSSEYFGSPSYLSNSAKIRLTSNICAYRTYLITGDTCVYQLDREIQVVGIKPRIKFTFDKTNVCPNDTITAIPLLINNAICGVSQFTKAFGPDLIAEYQGTQSNTNATPKAFTAAISIDRSQTQILYTSADLKRQGFKAGLVSGISFDLDAINQPDVYNSVKIRVKCTDRSDLGNLSLEVDTTMILIYDTVFKQLSRGWNYFPLALNFTYDDSTNLLFDIQTKCNNPSGGQVATSPLYNDHQTTYISQIGKYARGKLPFRTAPVVGSNLRHNIRFTYKELDVSSIKFSWKDLDNPLSTATTVMDTNSPRTKISDNQVRRYEITAKDSFLPLIPEKQICSAKFYVNSTFDTNFKIKLNTNLVTKCPADTVHITSSFGNPVVKAFDPYCETPQNPNPNKFKDTCRQSDSTFVVVCSNGAINTGTPAQSPFGGSTAAFASPASDKRIQIMIPAIELQGNPNMRQGIIRRIGFNVTTKAANPIAVLNNFTVRMKCLDEITDRFSDNRFLSNFDFQPVFSSTALTTVPGINWLTLQDSFSIPDSAGLVLDICYDNNALTYNGDVVFSTTTPGIGRCIHRGLNNIDSLGCTFTTGTLDFTRPNVLLDICKPTPPPAPIPSNVRWAPPAFMSNTLISNPVIYNPVTMNYFVLLDYINPLTGRNICTVRDSLRSNVNRPKIVFNPNPAVSCGSEGVIVNASVEGMSQNQYDYSWNTFNGGIDPSEKNFPNPRIKPSKPGYYFVWVYSKADPTCWSVDSVYVGIQQKSVMPNIGTNARTCPGDSTTISFARGVGYKNPAWYYNGNRFDTAFQVTVADTGRYYVMVDSGVCRNRSYDKIVEYFIKDTAKLLDKNITICSGDSVDIYYDQTGDIMNPLWNIGLQTPGIKVNQSGQYYLVNPRNQFGCLMHMRDTAFVTLINNPDFFLADDTLCLSANQSVTLKPSPYDPKATYYWEPSGITGGSLTVVAPNTYTVRRTTANCTKIAVATVRPDTIGSLNLGAKRAICCDEILSLDANPLRKPYSSYNWSTGEVSQIVYTKPNTSGTYIVEAIKQNGCKDTGSIFVDSKCTQVRTRPEKTDIQLGQTNKILGEHLAVKGNIRYQWKPSDKANKIINPDSFLAITKPVDTGDVEYILVMTVMDSAFMPPKPVCIENEVVRFKVKPNGIDLFNAFSPNGDGINDYFYPQVFGIVRMNEFKVYNRQGQLLHNDANNPWDGKYQGQYQPAGVYVGLISYDSEQPRKQTVTKYEKVNITILR
jgi:gliding motility-associated-like protein